MGPRGTPQKSIFWSQKWAFSRFPVSGLCRGPGGLQHQRLWAFRQLGKPDPRIFSRKPACWAPHLTATGWRAPMCQENLISVEFREAPVRFGSVTVWGWNGSSGSGFRFWRFLCKKSFSVFKYSVAGNDGSGSGFGFGSWKTVPAVPVLLSFSGKAVPTVPVSGSGSVPEPPWELERKREKEHGHPKIKVA